MSRKLFFPVYTGLLSQEHYDKIGGALWEFLWFISKITKEEQEENELIGIVLGGRPVKNAEIADELGTSLRNTERNISRLRKHGYITTKRTPYGNVFKVKNSKKFYENVKNMQFKERTAKNGGTDEREPPKMAELEGENRQMSYREPPNLVERTAKNGGNKEDIKDIKDINNIYVEIIDYLNQKTGKRFSPKSAANKKLINGRISEGRTLEDFKHVIDVKCNEWLGDDHWQQYLRPATLFRPSNFENYLNQVPIKNTKQDNDPRDMEIAFQKWMSEGGDPEQFDWKTGRRIE